MSKFKHLILSFMLLFGLAAAPLAVTASVAAQDCEGITGCLDQGSCETDEQGCAESSDATERVNNIIKLVINIFSLIVGVISVIMIIIGGLKYITSGGDSGNVTGAKNTILYAVIGLVVVALAQVIVRFVLQKTVSSGS
jgi:hypothetical protein